MGGAGVGWGMSAAEWVAYGQPQCPQVLFRGAFGWRRSQGVAGIPFIYRAPHPPMPCRSSDLTPRPRRYFHSVALALESLNVPIISMSNLAALIAGECALLGFSGPSPWATAWTVPGLCPLTPQSGEEAPGSHFDLRVTLLLGGSRAGG